MPVYYDSQRIIPAPFMSIRKEYQTTEDGAKIGSMFMITVKGKFVAEKGSPSATGALFSGSGYPADTDLTHDQHLRGILRKQEGLRTLFSVDGRSFEVQSPDGSAPLKCNPRIKSIEFADGLWYNICDYTIIMEADVLYINGTAAGEDGFSSKITKATEDWNLELNDEKNKTWRLTHSISATGKRFFNSSGALEKEAWQQAEDYVKARLGLDTAQLIGVGVTDNTNLQAFNYTRSRVVNKLAGGFSVNEAWFCLDPSGGSPAVEEYTIELTYRDNGITGATIQGTITGVETRDNTGYSNVTATRYVNGNNRWLNDVFPNLYQRCQNELGSSYPLNTIPVSYTVGKNINHGVITYNYSYDTRAALLVSGAISENITVNDEGGVDQFASIPVLGRPAGPVLQNLGTITAKRRTLTIEAQLVPARDNFVPVKPNTDALVLSFLPSYSISIFLDQASENFSPKTGRYMRTVSWTYE